MKLHATLLIGIAACSTPQPVIESAVDAATPGPFRFVDDEENGALQLYDGEALVLAYRYGDQLPEGVPDDRRRSSYVHPICGLDGEVLTEDFPKDHYHHRGLSLMWPRMKVRDEPVELWHIKGIRSLFREWLSRTTDDDRAILSVGNDWKLTDGTVVATETLTLTVHRAGDVGRAIDVVYLLDAREPVEVQGQVDKGYGGLNLRFAPRAKDSTALTTETGTQAKDSDKKHFAWADLSARFAGETTSGIAVFQRHSHPGFPAPWTLRHYGDLNVAWPGLEPVTIRPDHPVRLEYRIWLHRGDAEAGRVAEAYARFRGEERD